METNRVKFSEWMEQSFNLYKEHFAALIVPSVIATVLSGVTAGILAGPMMAGMILLVLPLVDKQEQKPDINVLFKGFDYFAQTFLFVLVWGLIGLVLSLILQFLPPLSAIAVVVLFTFLMFAPFLIVDQKMAFWPASLRSMQIVKANFWPLLGYNFVTCVLGSIGGVLCFIGVCLTMPLGYFLLATAYREMLSAEAAAEPVAPPPEPIAPPPAGTPDSGTADSGTDRNPPPVG